MENVPKAEGWTLLDFEGLPIAEGLPSKAAAVHAMLMDDGHDYEIRAEEGGGFRLWLLDRSRHSAGSHRFTESVIFSTKADEVEAEAEIFEKVAAMVDAGRWGGDYRIVIDADRAAELAEDDDEDRRFQGGTGGFLDEIDEELAELGEVDASTASACRNGNRRALALLERINDQIEHARHDRLLWSDLEDRVETTCSYAFGFKSLWYDAVAEAEAGHGTA
jgi:hypothetical protein